MMIIGVDYHPSFQQIAFLMEDTGEYDERKLNHSEGEAERFYRDLQQRGIRVRVGMEATGFSRWFERLLAELDFELWIGDPAEIKAKRVKKQKYDREDARLLLRLLRENNFPKIWVPSPENRDLRKLLWHRHRLVQMRTRIMNQLQALARNEGKRWKKKFRDRDRRGAQQNPGNVAGAGYGNDSHQPGNNAYGKRGKNKQQRGPRNFVGPMDHSYREVNGNFADAPPSTIETGNYNRRNGHGGRTFLSDSGPIDYSVGRPVPIDENAPTKIYFFIEDLFFLAKIQETARKLGVKVAFVKNDKEVLSQLTSAEEEDRPGLIVFDLNNANAKPLTLIPKLKAKLKKGTSIIGFLSHLQGDLKAKATEAGCDTVMARAAFSQNLPNLLRRYGAVEEDDNNYNQ